MPYEIILIRIFLSIVLGFILGLERQISFRTVGIKTHILVCTGSAVFTLLSIYGFEGTNISHEVLRQDPARIAAQIVTGIGFIGAGAIMKNHNSVAGVTTAATLWLVASVGMAVGAGFYFLGVITTCVIVIAIILSRILERNINRYLGNNDKKKSKKKEKKK